MERDRLGLTFREEGELASTLRLVRFMLKSGEYDNLGPDEPDLELLERQLEYGLASAESQRSQGKSGGGGTFIIMPGGSERSMAWTFEPIVGDLLIPAMQRAIETHPDPILTSHWQSMLDSLGQT